MIRFWLDVFEMNANRRSIFAAILMTCISFLTLPETLLPDKPNIQHVFYYGWISTHVTAVGMLPLVFSPDLDTYWIGISNALASGIMTAASYSLVVEGCRLDESDEYSSISYTMRTLIGVALGLVFTLSTKICLSKYEDQDIRGIDEKVFLIILVVTLHSFTEGVCMGVSSGGAHGSELGRFISSSLAIHNVSKGLAIAVALLPLRVSKLSSALCCIIASFPQLLMAVPAFLLVDYFTSVLPIGLGFAGGVMAWVSFCELLVNAFENTDMVATGLIYTLSLGLVLKFQGTTDMGDMFKMEYHHHLLIQLFTAVLVISTTKFWNRKRSVTPGHELLTLALSRQWKQCRQRVKVKPEDVIRLNVKGVCMLHIIFSSDFSESDDSTIEEARQLTKLILDTYIASDAVKVTSAGQRTTHQSLQLRRDHMKNTPLHALCYQENACPVLIELLLSYCSTEFKDGQRLQTTVELICTVNRDGCTPLHALARNRRSLEAMDIIFQNCYSLCPNKTKLTFPLEPSGTATQDTLQQLHPALIKDIFGDTPLHCACNCGWNVNMENIRALLLHCPSAVQIRNREGLLPIDYLWNTYTKHEIPSPIGPETLNFETVLDNNNGSMLSDGNEQTKSNLWAIINPMLEATYFGTVYKSYNNGEYWRPLHAAAGITWYSPNILKFAIQMEPQELSIRDEDGNLPIHIAAATKSQYSPLDNMQLLLDMNSNHAEEVNADNMLPLHLAAESKKNLDVILFLHKKCPDSLQNRCRSTRLFPFMTAAVGNNNTVDVIYALLRLDPELVRS